MKDDASFEERGRAIRRLTACGACALPDTAWAALHAKTLDSQHLLQEALFEIVEQEAGVREELRKAGKVIAPSITRRILAALDKQPLDVLRIYAKGCGRSDSRDYTLRLAHDPRGHGVRELTGWLKDPDPFLRWYTLNDLCDLGDLAAVPEIIDCLDDNTSVFLPSGPLGGEPLPMKEHALDVLRSLTGEKDVGQDSRAWRDWWAKQRQRNGARSDDNPSTSGEKP